MQQHPLYQAISTILFSAVTLYSGALAAQEQDVKQLDAITVYAENTQVNYGSKQVAVAGFGTQDLRKVPAAISTITSDLIADQHAKVLTEVIKNDASVGDGYAAIGYYPNVVSRGFALDLASSYLINGLAIRGEQNIPLENKERVEILKGISALQSGMSTPGGVVNYVTKRPKEIKQLNVSADSYGGTGFAVDLGGFWGQGQQFGYRLNAGAEDIHSYVDHANGKRYFGALALDWNIDERSGLQFDIESQYQKQRSVPGYQLLDGQVPEHVNRERLLGYQSWSDPVSVKALTTQLKYHYNVNNDWTAELAASHSRVVMDDNTAFPWGCYIGGVCQYAGMGNTFDANGNYDIYDYRIPDDTRQTTQYQASLNGLLQTGTIKHQLYFALSQTDKQRKRYQGINEYVGTGNIYNNTIDYSPSGVTDMGNRYKPIDSKQTALAFSDRVTFNPQWSALLGAKWIDLDEKAYNSDGEQIRHSSIHKFLPQLALIYSPWQDTNVYASFAKGLSDGGEAPWYAENADEVLAPVNSRQYELGLKQQVGNYLLTAAIFDLKQDNQYTRVNTDGSLQFVAEGKQHNQGIELGTQGQLTDALKLNITLAYIRSRLVDIDTVAYKNHQTQNVPKLRFATHLSYDVAAIEGLRLLGSMQASSGKNANKEGTAKVAGYTTFDIGAAYQFKPYGHDTTLSLKVENLFNKTYWRDVGGFMGDDYLFLGAPRSAKFAVNFNF
ncbi:TonB-dependent siderophore receptor [Acinetobacter qingfengensis]|uniref:TonB-dependent receptor n=2 Tax=Acinetobacter qingfengensis TaxID=1262585 RepID=A0A1E7R307_9GAMM|nr:TonB-dependent siderophore receptor [Acinetobacter qingfengensis]OEY93749.1 TonB-dependent receptor [Acinetobacter qingfengensis]